MYLYGEGLMKYIVVFLNTLIKTSPVIIPLVGFLFFLIKRDNPKEIRIIKGVEIDKIHMLSIRSKPLIKNSSAKGYICHITGTTE